MGSDVVLRFLFPAVRIIAKAVLMQRNHLTEEEAHRYIQKCSMDNGTNMVETAQMILMLIWQDA